MGHNNSLEIVHKRVKVLLSFRLVRPVPTLTGNLSSEGFPTPESFRDCGNDSHQAEVGRETIHKTDGGFTLLEIMIALAIIGGLLITLLYTLNYNLGIAERHEFTTVATLLARDKIEEVEAGGAVSSGAFPKPYSDYSFAAVIKGSPFPGISAVSVTVSRGSDQLDLTDFIGSKDETNKGM